jgi:hypothetical protein
MSRSIVTFPDSVFAEAWLDFASRIRVISEAFYVTPAQRAILPEYLQREMNICFERALALHGWEQAQQQKETTK